MIVAKNISHRYGRESALSHIDLQIAKGAFAALIGESGSGKTTLLAILSTLLQPSEGEVFLLGNDTKKICNIDRFRQENIGFIFQFHYLINYLSLFENITLALKDQDESYVHAVMEDLKIADIAYKYPYEISGGERQRAAIARAMANRPGILFADEPTGNLDKKNSDNVFELFKTLQERYDTTIVVATHDIRQAKKANMIYELADGHL